MLWMKKLQIPINVMQVQETNDLTGPKQYSGREKRSTTPHNMHTGTPARFYIWEESCIVSLVIKSMLKIDKRFQMLVPENICYP